LSRKKKRKRKEKEKKENLIVNQFKQRFRENLFDGKPGGRFP